MPQQDTAHRREGQGHKEVKAIKPPKARPKLAAAAAIIAFALSPEAAANETARGDGKAPSAELSSKRVANYSSRPVPETNEIMFAPEPSVVVTSGGLTTSASIISNPLPAFVAPQAAPGDASPQQAMLASLAERLRSWAKIAVKFETGEGAETTIYVQTPTTWEVGDLKDIISTPDSRYTILVFEKCIVVTLGFASAAAGEAQITIDRHGETIRLPSNSFHFMLPSGLAPEDIFAYAASDSGFAFIDRNGVLRISPLDVEGNFLRREIGAPQPGTELFFSRGLIFVVRPSDNCISVFDSRLDSRNFATAEELTGAPTITPTETGFEATFATSSGGTATYEVSVQSEGLVSSFVAFQMQE